MPSGGVPSKEAVAIIPAHLGSRRFPGKVLARESGKYLIQHVHEGVVRARGVSRTIIATDSREVEEAARSFGAEVVMTSSDHRSGTDRVAEVARKLSAEAIINVQGDEPLVCGEDLTRLVETLEEPSTVMVTLARQRTDPEGFNDPNVVKVVVDSSGRALYFSRAPIPSVRRRGERSEITWSQHVGIYGFRRDFLEAFTRLPPGELERREGLEQLRAMENGYSIRVLMTENEYRGIDTEEDYRDFLRRYGKS